MNRSARTFRGRAVGTAVLVPIAAAVSALIVLGSAAADTPPYTLPVSLPSLGERAVGRCGRAVHAGRAQPDRPARAHGDAHPGAGAEPRHAAPRRRRAPTATTSGPSGARSASTPRATSPAPRSRPRRRRARPTSRSASVPPFTVGQTIWIDATSDAEQVTIAAVGTAGSGGTGLDLTAPLAKAHANGRPAYVSLTTPEHRAHLLDGRAGRAQHVRPERARLHRADDADGPRRHVRPRARQRVGPDRGHRESRASWSPACSARRPTSTGCPTGAAT